MNANNTEKTRRAPTNIEEQREWSQARGKLTEKTISAKEHEMHEYNKKKNSI